MKRVEFETLKIEGFGGIVKYKTFKLNAEPLTILRGDNGSTKTTHFSSLFWALYGKTLKNGSTVETWEHVRPESWSGTMVSVSFKVNNVKCKITRCKKYTKVVGKVKGGDRLILEEGGEVSSIKSKPEIQKYINELLGVSADLFLINIIFRQKGERFIELKGPEKASILEQSFQLSWLNKAKELAKKDSQQVEAKVRELSQEINSSVKSITQLKEIIHQMEESKVEFEEEKKEEISKLRKKLVKIKKESHKLKSELGGSWEIIARKRSEVDTQIGAIKLSVSLNYELSEEELEVLEKTPITLLTKLTDDLGVQIAKLKRDLDSMEKVDDLIAKIGSYQSKESKICFTCGSKLEDSGTKALIETLRKKLGEEEEKLGGVENPVMVQKELKPLEEQKDQLNKFKRELDSLTRDSIDLANSQESIKDQQVEYERTLDRMKETKVRIKEEEAKVFKDRSKPLRVKLYQEEQDLEALELRMLPYKTKAKVSEWAIKGPLSNSGIKSFLFDKLLDKLNQRLKFYEAFSGFGIELMVNLDSGRKSIETVISVHGAPVDYKDMSGGESQLINVVIALASSDVLLSDVSINIRVFDEVSESLDRKNIEIVGGFLRQLSETYSVFVITHRDSVTIDGAVELKLTKNE